MHSRRGIFRRGTSLAGQLWRERSGSVAIMLGIALPVVIGVVALGTEIAFALVKHRQLQVVADAAALDAAIAIQKGYPTFAVEAQAVAASLGAQNGVNGVTVAANKPPKTGPNTNNSAAVEVIISQPQALSLGSLFISGPLNIVGRAVATAGSGVSCVLQLSPATGFTMNNGATATLASCGVAVDATGSSALSMSGGAVLNAQSVSVVGKASITNGAAINPSTALKTGQASVADPYANVTMPTLPAGCSNGISTQYTHSNLGLQTISPGVWCDGVSFTNDADVLLQPGVYYVNGGNFSVGGAVVMNGTGVTIILTSSIGGNYANVTIDNGATVTLSAPTSGTTSGIVFFGDRNAPAGNTSNFAGGATIDITGAVYFPSQSVVFQNGSSNPSGCTQLIAGTIRLTGGSKFQNNCPTGVAPIGSANVTLVE
jgi:Flp pilus assembly protein TadG